MYGRISNGKKNHDLCKGNKIRFFKVCRYLLIKPSKFGVKYKF